MAKVKKIQARCRHETTSETDVLEALEQFVKEVKPETYLDYFEGNPVGVSFDPDNCLAEMWMLVSGKTDFPDLHNPLVSFLTSKGFTKCEINLSTTNFKEQHLSWLRESIYASLRSEPRTRKELQSYTRLPPEVVDAVLNVMLRECEIKIIGEYMNSPHNLFQAIERGKE